MDISFEAPLAEIKSSLQANTLSRDEATSILLRSCIDFLQIQRASIWFNTDDDLLSCHMLLDKTAGLTQEPLLIDRWSFPTYFQALDSKGVICASDACSNLATKELYDAFLKPSQIRSLLDVPLVKDGKLSGIICCEHTHVIKHWSADEISFVAELAKIYQAVFDMH